MKICRTERIMRGMEKNATNGKKWLNGYSNLKVQRSATCANTSPSDCLPNGVKRELGIKRRKKNHKLKKKKKAEIKILMKLN